ncbi:uncharacterized protein LOC112346793 [Selaginella moellendorffii]|uniref:uncharacterized protein LOC112346793 n=1 Tax=Selaginella moellendorffii TaxID=88036 RepID=UPI000D1CCCD1|nr:uncharacterized protein LOC112346793 [Selaginella moellendorffii]|eukprot:XP_024532212.1 uncharacterized protein LOC112346793 [Selaginella moellendorffii]
MCMPCCVSLGSTTHGRTAVHRFIATPGALFKGFATRAEAETYLALMSDSKAMPPSDQAEVPDAVDHLVTPQQSDSNVQPPRIDSNKMEYSADGRLLTFASEEDLFIYLGLK